MTPSLTRARMLLEMNRPQEAEAQLQEYLKENMDDDLAWILLANALSRQNRFRKAEGAARRAVELAPECDSAHFTLARVLLDSGSSRPALASATEAVRLDPEDATNFALLARIQWEECRYRQAADAARRGLELDPEDESCRFYLGLALSRLGEHTEADRMMAGLLAEDAEDANNHAARGFQYLDRGDASAARRHFLEALRIESTHEGARDGLATALKSRNRLFSLLLRYQLVVSKFGTVGIIAFIVLIIGISELMKRGKALPWVGPVCIAGLALLSLFMMLTAAGNQIFTLMLLRDRESRHVVQAGERKAALWSIPLLLLAAVAVVQWLLRDPSRFPREAILLCMLCDPLWETFQSVTAWAAKRMALLTAVAVGLTAAVIIEKEFRLQALRQKVATASSGMQGLSREDRIKKLAGILSKDDARQMLKESPWSLYALGAVLGICMFSTGLRERLDRRAPDLQ